MRGRQTTNLLLQAGAEAVKGKPASVPGLAPLRAIKELHRQAADELGVDEAAHTQVEALLGELQQLLIGITIMQARPALLKMTAELPWAQYFLPLHLWRANLGRSGPAGQPAHGFCHDTGALRQLKARWPSCTTALP